MEGEKNRDPKLCNNAIRDFWDNERELVKQGQGTRDWDLHQQIDILNYKADGTERKHAGVPKDENGYAYEGHHMKSAEEYPKYQSQGDNIQALARDEHQAAHDNNFQNSTNGYYDPETGETTEFANSEPSKPEPKSLSNPYTETDEYRYRNNPNETSEQEDLQNRQSPSKQSATPEQDVKSEQGIASEKEATPEPEVVPEQEAAPEQETKSEQGTAPSERESVNSGQSNDGDYDYYSGYGY